ncbi:MAG TPA: glycine betaine ABC transporter substrate-binding protein, partial [Spirochaetota bacterium]|nr:glycine betaine ABC transporter substrate-binding protein [Spirochaetota bacterium]
IKTISDLKKHIHAFTPGFTAEFAERKDGLSGLKEKYNLDFKEKPTLLDPGIMYKAIKEKEVDLICGFATDGRIPVYNLQVLEDNKKFFPPYYAAPVIRKATLKQHPKLQKVLNMLAGKITDEVIRKLNYEIDKNEKTLKNVSRTFFQETGI